MTAYQIPRCVHTQDEGKIIMQHISFYLLLMSLYLFIIDVCVFPRVRCICLHQTTFSGYFWNLLRVKRKDFKKGGASKDIFSIINSGFLPDGAPVPFKFLSRVTKKMVLLYCDLQSKFPFMKQRMVRHQVLQPLPIQLKHTSGDNGSFYDGNKKAHHVNWGCHV